MGLCALRVLNLRYAMRVMHAMFVIESHSRLFYYVLHALIVRFDVLWRDVLLRDAM